MSPEIAAGIDVGTNAVKCIVARIADGRIAEVLHQDRRTCRLGEGLHGHGRLRPAAIARTCEAIAAMVAAAREAGATCIRAGATSAARDAQNTSELIACVRDACGITVEVLPGEEEARLTFLAISAAEGRGPLATFDVGGGSTECVRGEGERIDARISLPVGAVRARATWLPDDPPTPEEVERAREGVAAAVADLPDLSGCRIVGTGGTLRNLVAIFAQHTGRAWEEARCLPRAEIERQIEAFASCPLEERRKIPGIEPDRADIILGGALIVAGCLERSGSPEVWVTDQGLRQGLALYCAARG